MRRLILLCLLIFTPISAHALEEDRNSDGATRTIADYIESYVDVPEGGINWKVFGATKEVKVAGKDAEGLDYEYTKPDFAAGVKPLDGKTIIIKGFMFPLEGEEAQSLFLLGPFPISCPFHYHVGPSMVLEVHVAGKPIEFSYDPITVTGTLELVREDPENSVFYRLKNAHLVK